MISRQSISDSFQQNDKVDILCCFLAWLVLMRSGHTCLSVTFSITNHHGRLILNNKIVSNIPFHSHEEQNVEIVVHKSRQKLRKTAITLDFSISYFFKFMYNVSWIIIVENNLCRENSRNGLWIKSSNSQTLSITINLTYFIYHVMSRDKINFSPIACQKIILTLPHVGWYIISIQKYVDR